jgi:hypothetical protein
MNTTPYQTHHIGPAAGLAEQGYQRSARAALADQLRHLRNARADAAVNGELDNVANIDKAIRAIEKRLNAM